MLLNNQPQIAPTRATSLLQAAERAARAIPPAFPLSATVAVNPFLGQAGEDLATATARMMRVAGIRLTPPRKEIRARLAVGTLTEADLAAAWAAHGSALKPESPAALMAELAKDNPPPQALPSLAHIAQVATGVDWPAIITRTFGLWAAGHFDRGQALWSPAPGRSAFAAWRDWALHDLTPEIAGLSGFCAHIAEAPDTPERAIFRVAETLELSEAAAETAFHRLLIDLGGWAQHARWLLWEAELAGTSDSTITDLLAIRLIWEDALLAQYPDLAQRWAQVAAEHARPVVATPETVVDAIAQDALERAHQRQLAALLPGPMERAERPALQAAFCIDVRSEVYRRALESLDPSIETLGFAGFFGLPLGHKACGTDEIAKHLPVLLKPAVFTCSSITPEADQAQRITARAQRAWGRFRQAAVSSFAFIEAAGPAYGLKLLRDSLPGALKPEAVSPPPQLATPLPAAKKAEICAAVLRAMSFTKGHARLVLLLGHGARVTNNPHESAYHCGACGGQTGEVSARLLAMMLNDAEVRALLPHHGITLPADTHFIAGLHETTTDTLTLYPDTAMPDHAADLRQARAWLAQASKLARAERALRLPGAKAATLSQRALNWAEIRPEWGLAGCAAFIAAPRSVTARSDLHGRAFLHSYAWQEDKDFATLELILTAPVVVASWISLQYFGSSVAPDLFGGGNKLIHNVVGGIGVVQGNGGTLRPGLPWQAVHDGEALAHDPLRLSVMIEAPREAITTILAQHEGVRALFDHGWLHLFTLEQGRITARYRGDLNWDEARADAPWKVAA